MKNVLRLLLVSAMSFFASFTQASLIVDYTQTTPVDVCDQCTVSSSINVTEHGSIFDLNVIVNLLHSFNPDVTLWLTHDNISVLLVNQVEPIGANFENTRFDDEASQSIYSGISYAPYTGSFRPDQALSAFTGADTFGIWTLSATDNWEGDSGVLNSWRIQVDVPEPSPVILIGLGILALGLRRNINR